MRTLGYCVVALGVLILGFQMGQLGDGPGGRGEPAPMQQSALIGGIAVTVGLILVTVGNRESEGRDDKRNWQ